MPTHSKTGANYRTVTGLQRGLQVLAALNRMEEGHGTAVAVAAETGLHRTTVKRLLETLLAQGYVRRSPYDLSYRLQLKVRELADGFTDDAWVSTIATPELGALMKKLVWPSDLTTLDGDAMIVRETTRRFSPLAFHRNMLGRRLPLLFSASGRAYLAHCPERERRELLRVLATSPDPQQSRLAKDQVLIKRLIERLRRDGHALNDGEWQAEPHLGALAVPVFAGDAVLACLNVVYLRRALSAAEAAKKLLPALREAARGIQERVEREAAA